MKVPFANAGFIGGDEFVKRAKELALDLTLEYGILVEVRTEYKDVKEIWFGQPHTAHAPVSVQFVVMDHVFENLQDVRKALNNKAFL